MTHLHLNSLLISFSELHNSTAFEVLTSWVALLSSYFGWGGGGGGALIRYLRYLRLAILVQVTFANVRLKLAFLFFLVKTPAASGPAARPVLPLSISPREQASVLWDCSLGQGCQQVRVCPGPSQGSPELVHPPLKSWVLHFQATSSRVNDVSP